MNNFEGKIGLVTGGGRGLGKEISHCLARSGMFVVVADVNGDNAKQAVDEITKQGGKGTALKVDITDDQQVREAVEQTLAEFGAVDALVNNAGVDLTVSIEEMPHSEWDKIIATNLRGPFVLSKALLPHMRERRAGHIVNIVSTAAKRTWPNASAYHASKWGLLGFSHALHTESRPMVSR